MNFGNALCVTKILASKILVLYKCSPASYMNISRQCLRGPHCHQMEVAASSICNTRDLVSIPSDPVYTRVMSLATQLGTYTKLAQKQKATTLATMYVPSATLTNWPCRYGTCGTYAASNDVNVLYETYYVVESVLG